VGLVAGAEEQAGLGLGGAEAVGEGVVGVAHLKEMDAGKGVGGEGLRLRGEQHAQAHCELTILLDDAVAHGEVEMEGLVDLFGKVQLCRATQAAGLHRGRG